MRVLFLTHRLPFAPNRGDRLRAYHILRYLGSFAEVDLVSFAHSAEEASHEKDLEHLAKSVQVVSIPRSRNLIRGVISLAGQAPLTHVLLDAPNIGAVLKIATLERPPDVVLAYCSGMARFALQPPLAGLPFVIDLVDVDSLKWKALAQRSRFPMRWIYSREGASLSRFEASATRQAYTTIVVNARERDALARLAPTARLDIVPNGVDVSHFKPATPAAQGRDVVFCGVMDYAPNEEGAVWMARHVWPIVRREYPDACLKLVGSKPTARVKALADPTIGIDVTGHVADVRPYLWSSAVSVAPLFTARGIQNKVLEAIAAGLPTVVTRAAAEGLPTEVLPACFVEDTPELFAAAVLRLLALSPIERRARADAASLTALSWEHCLPPLRRILEGAVNSRRGPYAPDSGV